MSQSTTYVTIPQFSTRSLSYIVASPSSGTTFTNTSNLTSDPAFGTLFSVSGSNVLLTPIRPPIATSNTRFLLTNTVGSNSFVNLTVTAPSFSVSSSITLFQTLSRNLPIVLTPPSSISGYIDLSDIPCLIDGSNFRSNGYFVPSITPLGLTSSTDPSTGIVSITALPPYTGPILPRPASNFSYYVFDGSRNQMRTDFSIQVLPPSFAYSNVSGANVVGSNASITLNYKVSNDIRIQVDPVPQSFVTSGNFPLDVSLVGSELRLTGTPTSFIDISSGLNGVFQPTYGVFSNPPLTLNFKMNPALEFLNPPSSVTFYRNVPYTSAHPITSIAAQYYPTFTPPTYTWSVSSSITTLSYAIASNRLVFYGTLSDIASNVDVTVVSSTLSATTRLSLSAIPDSLTVVGPTSYTISQNVAITNLSFQAVAASDSAVPQISTFTSTPPMTTIQGVVLLPTGIVTGTPLATASSNFAVRATNPQGITSTLDMSFTVIQDTVTVLPVGLGSNTSLSSALQVIQGRDIALEYSDTERSFQAVASSGNAVPTFPLISGSPGTGLSYRSDGLLRGVPLFSGTVSFTAQATVLQGNAFASSTVYIRSISDQYILLSPSSTDFVVPYGSTSNVQLQGVAFSGLGVAGFTLSGTPSGVSITSTGYITLQGTSYQQTTPFSILVETTAGTVIPIDATMTVNDPTKGSFASPSTPTTLYFSNVGDTYPIATTPGYTYTLSGGSGFSIVGSSLVRTSLSEIYTPVLGVISASSNFSMPVRLATRQLTINPVAPQSWIQYANNSLIPFSTSSWPTQPSFAIPNIPPGMTWDPITGILQGSARILTIGDSFTVCATDGIVSSYLTVPYSVRAPAFLRGFSSPSAYTNYVRQVATVNGAYHAINQIAVLPDPLIASETGPYPPDIVKDSVPEECFN